MANLKVDTISGIGTEGPVLNGGLHFRSKNYLTLPKGNTTQRIATSSGISTEIGSIRYNTDSNKMECYVNNKWMIVSTSSPNLDSGTRAVFMGGFQDQPVNNTLFNTIDYVTISTAGDAIDFGDLLNTLFDGASNISSSTRQFSYMGRRGSAGPSGSTDTIEFITYATTGNSTDFGNSTSSLFYQPSGLSNSTRGIRGGGSNNPGTGGVNVIDFITMASEGNAVDFGDLQNQLRYGGGIASPTRGIFLWGNGHPAFINTMEFVTISTTGNSQDFGDLLEPSGSGAAGNATRGIVVKNNGSFTQTIQLATSGNAVQFGTLSTTRSNINAASSPTRIIFAGGVISPNTYSNIIDYTSIQTQGQAVNFGDLTVNRHTDNSSSNAHGGL